MLIKSLELSGFKSFVDRVTLNFKPGITALVGPNGCGKSNVIDAMRWIMGEHNARHLRGTKMEDLIFNGSENRRPTGMAEVSIILENGSNGNGGNGSPLGNAAELMVTRRLFRSGESEYYINKVPCRQKDIVELFLDSGVGTKSYSIMEQGKVDFILSLKPDERRILIEEAAGISKYRFRKKEALSKMESTRTNLSRLKDVLHEIQLQMHGLELQVKRLKRYRNLKEEIRQIDLLLASSRLASLSTLQAEHKSLLTRYQDEELRIIADISTVEAALETSRLQLTDFRKNLDRLQHDAYQIKSSIQNEENRCRFNEKEVSATAERIDRASRAAGELEGELQRISHEIAHHEQGCADVQTDILKLQENYTASVESLGRAKAALQEIRDRAEQEKSGLLVTAYEKTENKNALALNRRLHEEITRKLNKLADERQTCQVSITDLELRKDQFEKQLSLLIMQRENRERELETFRQRIACLSEDLQRTEMTLVETRDTMGSQRARLQTLQELQSSLEGFDEGVRSVMTAAGDNGNSLPGIKALCADVIEATPRYERAVEAALDRKLQSIIVERRQDSLAAIEYLKSNHSGRVSFIPLSLKSDSAHFPEEQPGMPLLSVVRTQPDYQPVLDALLGDVFLVSEIGPALESWGSLPRACTMVTEEGELIDSRGIVTGGGTNGAGTGILKRNREIREFSEQLVGLESRLEMLTGERHKVQSELQNARQSFELLAAERQELDIKLVQEKTNEEQAARDLHREKEKSQLLDFEDSESRASLERLHEEYERLRVQESDLEQAETVRRQALAEMDTTEAQVQSDLEQVETRHTDLRVQLVSAQQRLENFNSTLQRLGDQKKTAQSRMDTLADERAALERLMGTLESEIASAREQLASLVEQSRLHDEQISAEQKKIQECEAGVVSNEESLKQLRASRDDIEPKIHEAERNLSNLTIHLEHLDNELLEKYALPRDQLPPAPDQDNFSEEDARDRLEKLKKRLENIGEVNLGAAREFEELEKRYTFLCTQEQDLMQSLESLQKVIAKINRITRQKFLDTFNEINGHFQNIFPLLFNGGKAYMQLTDESDLLETGIDIFAQPPGKRLQNLDLLSGGERALTVISLMFAIFLTKPSPFCLMDEIDAPLDDSNIGKFITHLRTMAERSQFIIVTHNKLSMQAADSLYGITMEEHGISKVVSVELN